MLVDPQVEVTGTSLRNVIEGCGVFKSRITQMYIERGITHIDDEHWYPLHQVIDTIYMLADQVGPEILTEIGKAVPNNSRVPEQIDSFETFLHDIDVMYKANHRNGHIGSYRAEQLEPRKYHVYCDTFYPPLFNLGILRGVSRKFNTPVKIEMLSSGLYGGEFIVQW